MIFYGRRVEISRALQSVKSVHSTALRSNYRAVADYVYNCAERSRHLESSNWSSVTTLDGLAGRLFGLMYQLLAYNGLGRRHVKITVIYVAPALSSVSRF